MNFGKQKFPGCVRFGQPDSASQVFSVEAELERRFVAMLAADVAGYSRPMHRDEETTMVLLSARTATIDDLVVGHRRRIANTAGDSVMAEFASMLEAVSCAVATHQAVEEVDLT